MSRTILPDEILALIDINPPYFAFEDILEDNEHIYARVATEQPLGNEAGPISAAEASRHLAILGVCSCALKNPIKKRHYYLAYKGEYQRVETHSGKASSEPLTGKAICRSVDKRKAEAYTELLDQNGDVIVILRVWYHVILDTTFERLYKEHYIEHPDFSEKNPYLTSRDLTLETQGQGKLSAYLGEIPEYLCAGHFPQYPALPVAILAYNLFQMACTLLKNEQLTEGPLLIRDYKIEADNLAFAGDDVALEVVLSHSLDGTYALHAQGISNTCKSIGRIDMHIETHTETTAIEVKSNMYQAKPW